MLVVLLFSAFAFGVHGDTYTCPNNVTCVEKETCCLSNTGLWGCCPMESGVCCDDGMHCCSKGQKCLPTGNCTSADENIFPAFPLRNHHQQLTSVSCPDGSSCPDGNTCCQLSSGQYGCCPIREEMKFSQLSPSSTANSEIICPDATSLCPSTSTCCLASDSTWGCCPVENAVCCSDHVHCCPTHYKCDLHIFKCDHSLFGSIPLLRKQPAQKQLSVKLFSPKIQSSLTTIQCPDQKSYCPEETTCCPLENGVYGCCPYPEASCCNDKIHCCSKGYSCDLTSKRCIRTFDRTNRTEIIPSAEKIQAFIPLNPLRDQTCPDGKTKCSPSTTCCPNQQTNEITYSCCPYAKGVCCGTNGSVCCPNNYICDDKQLSCQLSDMTMFRSAPIDADYSQCGTSDFGCSLDQTCCRTFGSSDGNYACCTLADAQCCADGRHCCPKGTICDIQFGGCVQDE